jgi:acyl CoA:acetate/3-ketoacid CoA transferase alpha subunit
MSARTRNSPASTSPASWSSSSTRRARWPSACRAGGAGIPAFYTKTGVGTLVAEGKENPRVRRREYVMERGLFGRHLARQGLEGDTEGNLVYRKTARNFNPMMATAGRSPSPRSRRSCRSGELDPDHIHTPGIFVKRIVCGAPYEKRIEQRTVRKREARTDGLDPRQMAARAAKELRTAST